MTQRTTRKPTTKPADTTPAEIGRPDDGDPELQGEGNYSAARRHRASVERFVGAGEVARAARAAAPRNEEEARQLREAEKAGLAHARK